MSSDIEKEPLSRQQKKSKETKARIFHAAKTILQKQGYDQLSIKNICDEKMQMRQRSVSSTFI